MGTTRVSVVKTRGLRWRKFGGVLAAAVLALAGCGGGGNGNAGEGATPNEQVIVTPPPQSPTPPQQPAAPASAAVQALATSAPLRALPGDGLFAINESLTSGAGNLVTLSWEVQPFNANGTPNGTAVTVSTGEVEGTTFGASLTPLHDGGYVAVWLGRVIEFARFGGTSYALMVQAYSAAGAALGAPVQVDGTQPWFRWIGGAPALPVAAPLQSGGFVLAWVKAGDGGLQLFAQRFNPDATSAGAAHMVAPDAGGYLGAVGLFNGGYMITWSGGARAYTASDVPVAPGQADGPSWTGPSFEGTAPLLAPLASGGAVAVWTSSAGIGSQVMARELPMGADASALKSAALVGAASESDPPTSAVAAAGLTDGTYVVAWIESPANGSPEVHAQRYSATGLALGAETRIDVDTTQGGSPVVLALPDGGFVIGWTGTGSDSVRRDYLRTFASTALLQAP